MRAKNPKVFNLVVAYELQLIFSKILRSASDDLTYDKSVFYDGCPAEFFFGEAMAMVVQAKAQQVAETPFRVKTK